MATPTIEEVKARAKALTDDVQLQGYIDSASTIEAVTSMLVNSGYSRFEVNTVVRDENDIRAAEDAAVEQAKEEILQKVDDEGTRQRIQGATTVKEVKKLADDEEARGETGGWMHQLNSAVEGAVAGWFDNAGRVLGLTSDPNRYGGSNMSQMEQGLQEIIQRGETANDIEAVVDKALDADIGLSRDQIVAALTADDVADAINIIFDTMYEVGSTPDQIEALTEAFGEQAIRAATDATFQGSAATKEAINSRWGYEGDFAENHDFLIGEGWKVKLDADNNIFYIDPSSNRALDINNDDVGEWSPITGDIEFLTRTDARAPIGMGTGMFGTAESGPLNTNAVAGRPTVALDEWYELYGDEFSDVVTGKEWEDVLKEATGMNTQQIANFDRLISQGLGEDYTEGLETELHYQYLEGEQVNMFIDMSVEDMSSYQQKFEAMNVGYTAKKYGRFDQHFINLSERVMFQANLDFEGDPDGMRKVMDDMLKDPAYASNLKDGRGGGTGRVWRPPAYLAPDYAELSQAVKTTFESKMGRTASDAEIQLLSKKMGVDHRAEFDSQVQAQKLQFYGSGGPDAGTVQDVNYAARFQEDFGERYKDELGTLDKIEMSRSLTQSALGSILSADRAIGH